MVWGLPRCVWARESTAPAQGNQSLSRELRASALCPGLEARFPARRREERGCGPVTGKDRASCQSGGAPALRPGARAQSPGREAALAWASLAQRWKQWKQWQTLIWGAPKSLQMVTCSHEIKRCLLLESYDHPRQHIKKQRHYFANKGPSSQVYGFFSVHVWM